jgi:hypothetical protein
MASATNTKYHYVGQKPYIYKTGEIKDGKEVFAWSRLSVQIDTLYPDGHLQKHGILFTIL